MVECEGVKKGADDVEEGCKEFYRSVLDGENGSRRPQALKPLFNVITIHYLLLNNISTVYELSVLQNLRDRCNAVDRQYFFSPMLWMSCSGWRSYL